MNERSKTQAAVEFDDVEAVRYGTALVGGKRLHRYAWRIGPKGRPLPAQTFCGQLCDHWRRVPDEQWDRPPAGLKLCPTCEVVDARRR